MSNDVVAVGSVVEIREACGDLQGKTHTMTLVEPGYGNRANECSTKSPLGRALLGKRPGDLVRVRTDFGPALWTLVSVRCEVTTE